MSALQEKNRKANNRRINRTIIVTVKKQRGCELCGNRDLCSRDLHFHHRDRREKEVKVSLQGDMPGVRARFEPVGPRVSGAALSPSGSRAVFEARGEIFTVPAEKGSPRILTGTPGVVQVLVVTRRAVVLSDAFDPARRGAEPIAAHIVGFGDVRALSVTAATGSDPAADPGGWRAGLEWRVTVAEHELVIERNRDGLAVGEALARRAGA